MSPFGVCAVTRRRFPADATPARQLLKPEATGAVMEVVATHLGKLRLWVKMRLRAAMGSFPLVPQQRTSPDPRVRSVSCHYRTRTRKARAIAARNCQDSRRRTGGPVNFNLFPHFYHHQVLADL